ncbi:MAG: hypothetical protein JRH20_02390 [Deltaproteobacteria bacterium]|nr:hypothetical protein [Deltaproteobacteria bacterium]
MRRLCLAKSLVLVLCSILGAGCPAQKDKPTDSVYFSDLSPPLGVKVNIVSDLSFNRPMGGESTVRGVVAPDIDRDDLDRLLKTFYRLVSQRKSFKDGAVSKVDIRIYVAADQAKAGRDNYLGAVLRGTKTAEPTFENKQKLPLVKWAKKALGRMPQYVGKVKPRILANPESLTVEVTLPFVKMDGSGDWAEKVSFARAITAFAGTTLTLFRNIEQLKQMTYEGTLNDKPLLKVTLTREQAAKLELRAVQEGLGKFQGNMMEKFISKEINEKKMHKLLSKERRKVYKEVFKKMPEGALFMDKSLAKD